MSLTLAALNIDLVLPYQGSMNTNTVRLAKGSNSVRYEIRQGRDWATMSNSAGESAVVSLDTARAAIRTLVESGWYVGAV